MRDRPAKAAVCLFVVGVLGFQLWTITPLGASEYYWPFINYPMYSTANPPGKAYRERRLAIIARDSTPADTIRLSETDLGIYRYRYHTLLAGIAAWVLAEPGSSEERARSSMATIEDRSRTVLDVDAFDVVLEERRFEIGEVGLLTPDPAWEEIYTWRARAGGPRSP